MKAPWFSEVIAVSSRSCRGDQITNAPPSIQSGRLIAGADAGLALPEPGQFPDAGAHRIDVGGDIDVDQIGLVGGDALAEGITDVALAIDADAFDAAGARHRGKIRIVTLARRRIMEVGCEFVSAEIAALQPADRGLGVIVPSH